MIEGSDKAQQTTEPVSEATVRHTTGSLLMKALRSKEMAGALADDRLDRAEVAKHVQARLASEPSMHRRIADLAAREIEVDESMPTTNRVEVLLQTPSGLLVFAVVFSAISIGATVLLANYLGLQTLQIALTVFATEIGLYLSVAAQQPRLRRRRRELQHAWLESERKLREEREEAVETIVLPELRQRINELVDPAFDRSLSAADDRGLRDLLDSRYEVSLSGTERLGEMLGDLNAGSIGVAGPRGVGKTTLVRAACEGRLEESGGQPLPRGVMVSAPVRYAGQDFVRFLFAEVCLLVVGPLLKRQHLQRRLVERRLTTVATLLFSLGSTVLLAVITSSALLDVALSNVGIIAGTLLLVSAGLYLLPPLLSDRLRRVTRFAEDTLEAQALANLEQLRTLETRSEERSGTISGKLASISARRSVSRAQQAWTFPEVIGNYRRFIDTLTASDPILIGIDELDKMASAEEACAFLNEMKSLFDQRGAYYLVSVSEDALSAFERRGQPIRDVFDSVFSDILHVDYLSERESERLLRRRVVGIPPPWPALFHCLAGGLPRESLRVARRAFQIAEHRGSGLDSVALFLAAERVAGHEHGAAIVAAEEVEGNGRQPVLTWLNGLPLLASEKGDGKIDRQGAIEALRKRIEVADVVARIRNGRGADPEQSARAERLERLVAEVAAGAFHCLCCFEFFAGLEEPAFLRSSEPDETGVSAIQLLAKGHQDLASAPELAWQTLNRFRERAGGSLTHVAYPLN